VPDEGFSVAPHDVADIGDVAQVEVLESEVVSADELTI
jgi:hypothetical protein